MIKITSVNNDLVKETAKLLRSKHREETDLFLIEGEKGVQEAIESGLEIERIFIQEGLNTFSSENVVETNEAVLAKISDAKTAPKVVAVAKQPQQDFSGLKNAKKVILLEGIKDAGNLGTILRTSVAFGIEAVILYGNTVDLYNPKTVRSAVGNLWKIPVYKIKSLKELENYFSDFERIATLPRQIDVINLSELTPAKKVLVMFGSEADGLSDELKNFATKNVTIEMSSEVESLNLSISAAIIMYKLMK